MSGMTDNELLKRISDLAERCARRSEITMSNFLTPAEQYYIRRHSGFLTADAKLLFSGGGEDCERTAAFFLPDYMEPEYFDPCDYIKAIKLTAHFGTPGHRDYMGALLGMGIERDRLGDIRVVDNTAYVFCLPGIFSHLISIDKVGRCGVKAQEISPSEVPLPVRNVKRVSFSVMSPRLDAVVGGMFNLSRTEAARQIAAQRVIVNYSECERTDLIVHEGDIISLTGSGKGTVAEIGGTSRKGRTFVTAEILK